MAQTRVKAGMIEVPVNAQTGTTYTYLATDRGKLVTHSNASAIAATLPQATGSFAAGFSFRVKNIGVGTLTITPTTSTINGDATLVLVTDTGAEIFSDGTNWIALLNTPAESERTGKNYIVNPGMRVSQEYGTTANTTNGIYSADQFYTNHSQDGTLTSVQVASATPGGSTHRYRLTVTSPDASIAAGQYANIQSPLEGLRVADLLWGTANAKDIVVRFGWKSPAGTYALAIINQDSNRTFVREFTIAGGDANVDTVHINVGDTTGTWDSDNTVSMKIVWTIATGSTYQTTAGSWQSGVYLGTSSTSNGIGTGSDVFELFDVGMYADPDSTGIAPPFELPHYDDDLRECQRYWQSGFAESYVSLTPSQVTVSVMFPVPMRATPSVTVPSTTPAAHTAQNITFNKFVVSCVVSGAYVQTSWTASARM